MRVSVVLLPIYPLRELRHVWQAAEALGTYAGYTYDHLSWRSFVDRPWYAAMPTLTAAALTTTELRIGTLVTSPNFRHPVTLAKELMTIDELSSGRVIAGIGSGGTGFDATVLGGQAWSPRERAERFGEFLALLDLLLREPTTDYSGEFYQAVDAKMIPGCRQEPRVPFIVAAAGPKAMAAAAAHGQGWVTYGDPRGPADVPVNEAPAVVERQMAALDKACAEAGRPDRIKRVLLQGSTAEKPLESVAAFVDWASTYRELGIDEVVLHWPVPDSVFAADQAVFERILTDGVAQVR